MKYYDIVASENSDDMYDAWSEYRNQITEHIISSIENHIIKMKLKETSSIRLKVACDIESLISSGANKQTLAIWGAGGCNDIDIKKLSEYFKLVLIDRNIDALKKVKNKYQISDSECLTVDLKFWDIEDEMYEMFEALLKDVTDVAEVIRFLGEVTTKMTPPNYKALPNFDYSVAIGLVSQLNARFAALLYLYKELYSYNDIKKITEYINYMNEKAVEKFLESITLMTNKCIILGYELSVYSENEDLSFIVRTMNDDFELFDINNVGAIFECNIRSSIAGNIELEKYLFEKNYIEKRYTVQDWKTFVWPFSNEKNYIMLIGTFDINDAR